MFFGVSSSPFRLPGKPGSLGRSQVFKLIACLAVCSQSVNDAAMLARQEVELQENIESVCVAYVCVFPVKASAWHAFRRYQTGTHLSAKRKALGINFSTNAVPTSPRRLL